MAAEMTQERICEQCGAPFTVKYPSSRKRACSRSCGVRMGAGDRSGPNNSNWRGGKTEHSRYATYLDMIARCHRPTHPRFADYGGRGISVCDRWREDFWAYVADIGDGPPDTSLDRIDNDGNYEPTNVRWATLEQQANNKRGFGPELQRNQLGQFTSERA